MKTCIKCHATKWPGAFAFRKDRGKLSNTCKACENTRSRVWQKSNPERVKKIMRKHDLKRAFGLTPEGFDEMLDRQNGGCEICKHKFSDLRRPRIDHCHKSGKVRALLCNGCNFALGHAQENPVTLRAMAAYVERHL